MEEKLLLGEILIKRKCITEEQLKDAIEQQKKEKVFLGEILVKLGYLEERDIVVALIVQCGFPYIAINKYLVDKEVLKLISKEVAIKEKVVPLDRVGDVLSVVMINPLNVEKKLYLEQMTKCRLATFICTRTELDEAIAKLY